MRSKSPDSDVVGNLELTLKPLVLLLPGLIIKSGKDFAYLDFQPTRIFLAVRWKASEHDHSPET
jgi:hypothetical protein